MVPGGVGVAVGGAGSISLLSAVLEKSCECMYTLSWHLQQVKCALSARGIQTAVSIKNQQMVSAEKSYSQSHIQYS